MDTSPKGSMTRDELQGDMNDLLIGSEEEQWAARLRILAEFDRLNEKYQKLWDENNLLFSSAWVLKMGKEGLEKHCSHLVDDCLEMVEAQQVLERLCEPITHRTVRVFGCKSLFTQVRNWAVVNDNCNVPGAIQVAAQLTKRICDYYEARAKGGL